MRIICLVPSITETLIDCKINVVGRSRFCIHPATQVASISKVGGTKDVDWSKTLHLKPDLVVLDKEENTVEMAKNCPYPYIALHINSIADVAPEMTRLAERLNNTLLAKIGQRWHQLSRQKHPDRAISNIPGMLQWWRKPQQQSELEYLIWKDPWMAIGNNTFIQSVLDHLGLTHARIHHDEKYPQVSINADQRQQRVLLFSSEPFPFERHKSEMLKLGFSCGLIDGEKFSWYGIRSLEFLESIRH